MYSLVGRDRAAGSGVVFDVDLVLVDVDGRLLLGGDLLGVGRKAGLLDLDATEGVDRLRLVVDGRREPALDDAVDQPLEGAFGGGLRTTVDDYVSNLTVAQRLTTTTTQS